MPHRPCKQASLFSQTPKRHRHAIRLASRHPPSTRRVASPNKPVTLFLGIVPRKIPEVPIHELASHLGLGDVNEVLPITVSSLTLHL